MARLTRRTRAEVLALTLTLLATAYLLGRIGPALIWGD